MALVQGEVSRPRVRMSRMRCSARGVRVSRMRFPARRANDVSQGRGAASPWLTDVKKTPPGRADESFVGIETFAVRRDSRMHVGYWVNSYAKIRFVRQRSFALTGEE